ncbi:MAG: glycogen/starch synthase [Polyangiaceae bacterium]
MEILLVGTELSPWLSSSEAPEELAALGKSFKQLGHDVTMVVPYDTAYERGGLLVARRLSPLELTNGHAVTVFDAQLSSGAKVVLLGMPAGAEWPAKGSSELTKASAKAMAVFARAVAAYVDLRAEQGQPIEAVHLFDAETALVAHAIRTLSQASTPIVLTLCDLSNSGLGRGAVASECEDELLVADAVRLGDDVCLLKAGLLAADAVIMPSDTAVEQLKAGELFGALNPFVSAMRGQVLAVAAGIDYSKVNPATCPSLLARFDAEDVRNKAANKTDWLRHTGLSLEPRPLVLVPGPITGANGAGHLLAAVDLLLEMDLSLCVFESPSDDPEQSRLLASKLVGRQTDAAIFELTHEDQIHRAFAAADFVLYPDRDGRGVLGHRAAQRYGAVVVAYARSTIGESVVDADAGLVTGTGFLFDELEASAISGTVARALTAYHSAGFERLRRRTMRQDVSWDRPARRLLQIYQKCQRGGSSLLPQAG